MTSKGDDSSGRQQFQADYYNDFAGSFDIKCRRENSNHLYKIEQIADIFFRHLPPERERFDFLEVGTGTGIHAYNFLKAHAAKIGSITLTDISENMLKQAETRLQEFSRLTNYVVMPAEKFATDKCFDGIFVSGSMHHFADPVAALAEMKRHLKPSGIVVICEPVVWNPVNMVKALREIRAEFGQFSVRRGRIRRHLREQDYQILDDRVLHYRSGNPLLRRLIPYRQLEKCAVFDPLAIMFLFGARADGQAMEDKCR